MYATRPSLFQLFNKQTNYQINPPTDQPTKRKQGPAGIASFFARHRCNGYCRPEWTRPRDQTPYLPAECSTSTMSSEAKAAIPGNKQFAMAPPPPRRPPPRPVTYRPDLPPLSEEY